MLLEIHPANPDARKIKLITEALGKGDVIIYPTDTVYGLGCDIMNAKAIERICRIRKLDPEKANLTIICKDMSQISEFVHQMDNQVFRMVKQYIPGPYTFIFKASNNLPKSFKNRKKTVGIRVTGNRIAQTIIEELGHPILSLSLKEEDDLITYLTDPYEIWETYQHAVDYVIDGGPGNNIPSTVIDCTVSPPEIIREGVGHL